MATIPVGRSPHNVQVSPDGRFAWVTNEGGSRKAGGHEAASGAEHDKSTERGVVATVPVGAYPHGLRISPDGKFAYIANQGTKQNPGKTVSVIDLATRKVVKTVETGPGAHGVAVDSAGQHVFVTNIYDDTVSVLDASSAKVLATIPVGREPNGISVAP